MVERVCALFLAKELRRCYQAKLGPAQVLTASAAIHFHHWVCGLPSLTSAAFCGVAREVARRTLRTSRAQKDPVPTEQIDKLLRLLVDDGSLPSLVLAVAIALGFYGFLRSSEILAVMWRQIRRHADHFEIFIVDSKTDAYHEGRWLVVAAAAPGSSAVCPVWLLERLLQRGSYAAVDASAPEALLIRSVSATPKVGGFKLRRTGVCYSTLLAKAKVAFERVGVPARLMSLHVLRISGATEAARAEVPDRLTLNQGGWRSLVTMRGYTREGLPAQAKVSQAILGLLDSGEAPEFT
jgi:integrase